MNEELERIIRAERLEHGVVILDEVVDAKRPEERQPENDDGGKDGCQARRAERLDREQQNDNATGGTDDGGVVDIALYDFQPLHGTEDGLRRREDAVGKNHGHGQHANRLERATKEAAFLNGVADPAVGRRQVASQVPLHVDEVLLAGVALGDVGLGSWCVSWAYP